MSMFLCSSPVLLDIHPEMELQDLVMACSWLLGNLIVSPTDWLHTYLFLPVAEEGVGSPRLVSFHFIFYSSWLTEKGGLLCNSVVNFTAAPATFMEAICLIFCCPHCMVQLVSQGAALLLPSNVELGFSEDLSPNSWDTPSLLENLRLTSLTNPVTLISSTLCLPSLITSPPPFWRAQLSLFPSNQTTST